MIWKKKSFQYILLFHFMFFSVVCTVIGQDMTGLVLGNYSGINSVQVNPSGMHNSKTYLDIQFLGVDLFLQNNFLYLDKKDYRFLNFFKPGYELPVHTEDYGTEERTFYVYHNKRVKNIFSSIRINGPGAMLIWGNHAFAITTAARQVASIYKVPYDLANFSYLGLNFKPQQNINYQDKKPFSVAELAWAEIGLSYAYTFYARGFNKVSAGISARRLFGIAGGYVFSRQLDYIVIDDSTLNVKNFDADIGLAIPVDYGNNLSQANQWVKGGGFAFDIGLTYVRTVKSLQRDYFPSLCAQRYDDYEYRIGIALIDIGAIHFRTNARKYRIDNRASYWDNLTSFEFRDINQLMDTVSYKFYGDNQEALVADQFYMWLPTAFSFQFDYHFRKNWYVNASLIYGIPLSRNAVGRPAELSITPRYETRNFEVSLPVSLYDWYLTRIGLAFRVYGFTIGTDKLGGFFNLNDFTGLDLYFSIKLFFNKGRCRGGKETPCGNLEFKP